MNIRTLALVFGSAIVVAGSGMAATACSSNNSSGGTSSSGGGDSGAHPDGTASSSGGGDDGGASSSGGEGGGSSGGDAGTGPDCGNTPSLHATEAGTIFCGYEPDGGPAIDCPTGKQCCLGGALGGGTYAPEECVTWGTACTNPADGGIPIACGQISDCTANGQAGATACCLQGATVATVAGCGFPKYSHGTGIVCEGDGGGAATACAAGETQICTSQADCPAGKTCTAGKWKIYQLGFCE
jgi:hypothetical protein